MTASLQRGLLICAALLLLVTQLAFTADGFGTGLLVSFPSRNQQISQQSTQLFVVSERDKNAFGANTLESESREEEDDFFFIRNALQAELGPAADILSEAFFKENTNFFSYQWERLTTYLSLDATYPKPGERHSMFVACHSTNGKVLGLAEIDDRPSPKDKNASPRPYMYNVAVDPKWRRKGIAKALVLECEKMAQNWDKPEVYLKVRDTSQAAIAMYKSLGYLERSSSIEKLNDKYQNLLVMSKRGIEENKEDDGR